MGDQGHGHAHEDAHTHAHSHGGQEHSHPHTTTSTNTWSTSTSTSTARSSTRTGTATRPGTTTPTTASTTTTTRAASAHAGRRTLTGRARRPPHAHPAAHLARPAGALRLRRLGAAGARARRLRGADDDRRPPLPRASAPNTLGPGRPARGGRPPRRRPAGALDRAGDVRLLGASPRTPLDLARFLNDHLAEVVPRPPDAASPASARCRCRRPTSRSRAGALRARARPAGRADRHARQRHEPRRRRALPVLRGRRRSWARRSSCTPGTCWAATGWQQYWLPWLVGMPAETAVAICSLLFGGVLERLPRLRIALRARRRRVPRHRSAASSTASTSRPDLCAIDTTLAPRDYLRRRRAGALLRRLARARRRRAAPPARRCSAPSASRSAPTTRSRSARHEPGALIRSLGLDPEAERARCSAARRSSSSGCPRHAPTGRRRERRRAGPTDAGRARARRRATPRFREAFHVPPWPDGRQPAVAYFAGNSLGLQPHAARAGASLEELDDWARLGVEGHLEARRPWLPYHELAARRGRRGWSARRRTRSW